MYFNKKNTAAVSVEISRLADLYHWVLLRPHFTCSGVFLKQTGHNLPPVTANSTSRLPRISLHVPASLTAMLLWRIVLAMLMISSNAMLPLCFTGMQKSVHANECVIFFTHFVILLAECSCNGTRRKVCGENFTIHITNHA